MAADLATRFGAFAMATTAAVSNGLTPRHAEFEVALLVAEAIDAGISQTQTRTALADMLKQLDPQRAPWENLRALGFRGNRERYEDRDNSAIHRVLAACTGIPISLAVVLIEAARAQGLAAVGINHPGHFLVRIEQELVDPFDLQVLDPAPPQADQLTAISAVELGLRMLNNLKFGYARNQVWHEALAVVGYQLAMLPGHPQLLCDQGDYWVELGGVAAARKAYEQALADVSVGTAPNLRDNLRRTLQERLARIASSSPETLH